MATFGADLKLMTFDPKKSVDYRQTKKNPLEKRLILLTAILLPRYLYCRRFCFFFGELQMISKRRRSVNWGGSDVETKGNKTF